jgi:hypothetical protein
MLAAIQRQGPDYVPCSLLIHQGPWYREPLYWRDQFERAERLLELGLDPTIDLWLPDPEPHPDVQTKTWREKKEGEILITKEFHTPAGVLRQTVRETRDWCSADHAFWQVTTFGIESRTHYGVELFDDHNVSRRTEPWVKGPEDLEKLPYLIRPPSNSRLEEWRMDVERAIEFAREHELMTHVRRPIVGDAFLWFCDTPWFILQLYDDPDFVEQFLGLFHDWDLRLLDLILDFPVDFVQYRGWYETPTYWGYAGFKRFLAPLIEEQTRRVHDAGVLQGYLLPEGQGALADLLAEMSFDTLVLVDPRMLHVGDLCSLFAQLGDHKSFWGGVDAEVTLHSGDPERIDAAVREAIESLGGNGGLILSAALILGIKEQAILEMIKAWHKYRDIFS